MSEILRRADIKVTQNYDCVTLNINALSIPIYYQIAIQIAKGLRLASKQAMLSNKERPGDWRSHAELDESSYIDDRNTYTRPEKIIWQTASSSELVKLTLNKTEVVFHYLTALQISEWLRVRAKQAKKCLGDESKNLTILATLTAKQ